MKSKYVNHLLKFLCLWCMLGVVAACTEEDMSECEWIPAQISIVVKAAQESGIPVNPSDVKSVRLYVYDSEGFFLEEIQTTINTVVQLNYPKAGLLHIAAVANVEEENICIDQCSIDGNLSGGSITLIKESIYKELQLFRVPCDLFFGVEDIANNGQPGTKITELPISRIVSSTGLTILGLEDFVSTLPGASPNGDDKYSVVFSTNGNKVDFNGIPSGGLTDYKPRGAFNASGEYKVLPFNMISSVEGESITIMIFKNDQLIDSVSNDKNGIPLKAVNGKLLNVLIDYSSSKLTVSVSVTEWGDQAIWGKEFH